MIIYPFQNKRIVELVNSHKKNESLYLCEDEDVILLQEITPATHRIDSIQPSLKSFRLHETKLYISDWCSYIQILNDNQQEEYNSYLSKFTIEKHSIIEKLNELIQIFITNVSSFLKEETYILRYGKLDNESTFLIFQFNTKNGFDYIELDMLKECIQIHSNRYRNINKTVYGGYKLNKIEKAKIVNTQEILNFIHKKTDMLKEKYLTDDFVNFEQRWDEEKYTKINNEYLNYLRNPDKFIFEFNQQEITF